ncbi:MAG: nicotinate (nicotinamide) nucleotide adenylyltransferase [Candidatus Muiribacteriota bacterium]
MKTGVLGGTFDPFHCGHLYIATELIKRKVVDNVCLVPTYSHAHKTDEKITDFNIRLEMLEIAVKNEKKILISDIESRMEKPSYTYKTLKKLSEFSENDFYLIIGKDQLWNFNKWYKWKEISQEFKIIVFDREINQTDIQPDFLENLLYTEILSDKIQISSTDIREKVKCGKSIKGLVPEVVEKYILKNGLYKQ